MKSRKDLEPLCHKDKEEEEEEEEQENYKESK